MIILNRQEKVISIFLLGTALAGSVIGIFRHNWISNPEILLSPKNLQEVVAKAADDVIINNHKIQISQKNEIENIAKSTHSFAHIVTQKITETKIEPSNPVKNDANKTVSIEKNIEKNSSGLININITSKQDFMALPNIGEVKAGLIIQLRNEMGNFASIKDLEKVKGIGPKTLAKIEPFITI